MIEILIGSALASARTLGPHTLAYGRQAAAAKKRDLSAKTERAVSSARNKVYWWTSETGGDLNQRLEAAGERGAELFYWWAQRAASYARAWKIELPEARERVNDLIADWYGEDRHGDPDPPQQPGLRQPNPPAGPAPAAAPRNPKPKSPSPDRDRPTPPADLPPSSYPYPAPASGPLIDKHDTAPAPSAAPGPAPGLLPAIVATHSGVIMSTPSVSAENVGYDALRADLLLIANSALDDLEIAQKDAARAAVTATYLDQLATTVAAHGLDPATVAEIQAIAEAARGEAAAHQALATAAALRAGNAQLAYRGVTGRWEAYVQQHRAQAALGAIPSQQFLEG